MQKWWQRLGLGLALLIGGMLVQRFAPKELSVMALSWMLVIAGAVLAAVGPLSKVREIWVKRRDADYEGTLERGKPATGWGQLLVLILSVFLFGALICPGIYKYEMVNVQEEKTPPQPRKIQLFPERSRVLIYRFRTNRVTGEVQRYDENKKGWVVFQGSSIP